MGKDSRGNLGYCLNWEKDRFRECLLRLILEDGKTSINAYSPIEIITEKFRALIQQVTRPHERSRRQDVYDINFLIRQFEYDEEEKKLILENLIAKSESRDVHPNANSISDPKVKESAKKEWHTIRPKFIQILPRKIRAFWIIFDIRFDAKTNQIRLIKLFSIKF